MFNSLLFIWCIIFESGIVNDVQLLACNSHRKMLILIKMIMISVAWSRAASSWTVNGPSFHEPPACFRRQPAQLSATARREQMAFSFLPSQASVSISLTASLPETSWQDIRQILLNTVFQGKCRKMQKGGNDAGMTRNKLHADCDETGRGDKEAFAFYPWWWHSGEKGDIKC